MSVLAVALTGCSQVAEALSTEIPRDAEGNVLEPKSVDPDKLLPGDCFNDEENDDAEGFVFELVAVPCDGEHDGQVYARVNLSKDDGFPLDMDSLADEACSGDHFTNFVGVDYDNSVIYGGFLTPTEESWSADDNPSIMCYLTGENAGDKLTGDLEGANI